MKQKARKFTWIAVIFVYALALLSACGILEDTAALTVYDFGTDQIPSVNAVIGAERTVTEVEAGTSNGMQYKQYTYETGTMQDDLSQYLGSLREDGWQVLDDGYNLSDASGEAGLAIESADEEKILIIRVSFEESEYTIRIEKGDGTLTPYE